MALVTNGRTYADILDTGNNNYYSPVLARSHISFRRQPIIFFFQVEIISLNLNKAWVDSSARREGRIKSKIHARHLKDKMGEGEGEGEGESEGEGEGEGEGESEGRRGGR